MSYQLKDIQLNRASYLLRKSKHILLCGHQKPDADSIGSILALRLALSSLNKQVLCLSSDPVPENLKFLPRCESIKKEAEEINNFDLVVILDSSSLDRSSLQGYTSSLPILNIDHHQDNQYFGLVNIVDSHASSVAEILYSLLLILKAKITPQIATCLAAGIFFDTDAFRNPNTTSQTLKITSSLLASGAHLKQTVKYLLQEKSLSTLKLWGKALARLKENKYGIVATVILEEDLRKCQTSGELEGIANFLNCLPQAKACLLLSEQKGQIRGNLRTLRDNIDVSKLAALFGGGGHKKAAGFTISGKLGSLNSPKLSAILNEITDYLKVYG